MFSLNESRFRRNETRFRSLKWVSIVVVSHRVSFLNRVVFSETLRDPNFEPHPVIGPPGVGGGLPYGIDGDACRLAWGCKFRILVSLRVFWQNVIIFSRQGLVKGCMQRNNKTERILILYIYSIHINKFTIIKSHCTFYLSVL